MQSAFAPHGGVRRFGYKSAAIGFGRTLAGTHREKIGRGNRSDRRPSPRVPHLHSCVVRTWRRSLVTADHSCGGCVVVFATARPPPPHQGQILARISYGVVFLRSRPRALLAIPHGNRAGFNRRVVYSYFPTCIEGIQRKKKTKHKNNVSRV